MLKCGVFQTNSCDMCLDLDQWFQLNCVKTALKAKNIIHFPHGMHINTQHKHTNIHFTMANFECQW